MHMALKTVTNSVQLSNMTGSSTARYTVAASSGFEERTYSMKCVSEMEIYRYKATVNERP